jgi:hypothetical protein
MDAFRYEDAFSRNLGWTTAAEQTRLRGARVAIAGLGGVGGFHALTLARLGIGRFHIADFDRFDLPNFNRQAGASISTIGRTKIEVIGEQLLDINPQIALNTFPDGVSASNLDAFLDGVDVYIDGLDFFAFEARRQTFEACARKGIFAVTAAPLGMGTGVLVFKPGGMTFEEYFGWAGADETEMALRFLVGLAPAGLHRGYLVDPSHVDLAARRGPSTAMGCYLCAGAAATETLKILLNRGKRVHAPHGYQFDAYTGRLRRTWRPGGNRHPLQKLALAIARRMVKAKPAS